MKNLYIEKISSLLLLLFFLITPIANKLGFQSIIIYTFLAIGTLFFIIPDSYSRNFLNNKILRLWCIYIIIGGISTLLFMPPNGLNSIFYEITYTYICLTLLKHGNIFNFFIYFRNALLILALLTLFSQLSHINIFYFMNTGTAYTSYEAGATAIFEYRHYYGVYLIIALIFNMFFPIKSIILNLLSDILLFINILLTFTRNTWIILVVILILFYLKKEKQINIKFIIRMFFSLMTFVLIYFLFNKQLSVLIGKVISRLTVLQVEANNYGGISGARGYSFVYGIKYILDNWQRYIWIGGGNGFALNWLALNPYGLYIKWTSAIDNQYITSFMNSGIAGTLVIFIIIINGIMEFIHSKNRLTSAVSLSFIAMNIMMIFVDVLGFAVSPFILWIILIIVLGSRYENDQSTISLNN